MAIDSMRSARDMRASHTASTTLTTALTIVKNQRCQPPACPARKLNAAPGL